MTMSDQFLLVLYVAFMIMVSIGILQIFEAILGS